MADKNYYPEVIVAALDIIGMRNLIKHKDDLNSATKIIGQLCGIIESNSQLKFHWKQFGDSAYLFADPKDLLDTQLEKIAFSVASLTAFSMFAYELKICDNFLLRSGIAKGDLKAAQWNTGKTKGNFFIGNSMAKAVELEHSQNWFGACIDSEISYSIIKNKFIKKYDKIPKKKKNKEYTEKGYAINWLEIVKQMVNTGKINISFKPKDICEHIKMITKKVGYSDNEKKDIVKKIENTENFVKYCLE